MIYLRKNLLPLVAIILQVGVLALLIFFHGVGVDTDLIFFGLSVLLVGQLITLLVFDQFMVFFNQIRFDNKNARSEFYWAALFISGFWSLIVVFLSYFLISFAQFVGSDSKTINDYMSISLFFLISLPGYVVFALNDRLYNAIGEIEKSYFMVLIPNLSLLIAVSLWTAFPIYFDKFNVAILYSFFVIVFSLISLFFVLKIVPFAISLDVKLISELVKNSVIMRFSNNIYAISFQLINSFLLIGIQDGALTIFNYAYRSFVAIITVAVGPANKIYLYVLSRRAARNKLGIYFKLKKIYLKDVLFLYSFLSLLLVSVIYFFSQVAKAFPENNFSSVDFESLMVVACIMVFWYAIVVVESAYIGVIVVAKKSVYFLLTNIVFVVSYYILATYFSSFNNVSMFSLAGLISQLISFILYFYLSRKIK